MEKTNEAPMGIRNIWIRVIPRAATGTKSTRTLLTPLGVIIFGGFTTLFVLVNAWELKYIEEPELAMRFGDEYIEYRRRTPMFLPRAAKLSASLFGRRRIRGR